MPQSFALLTKTYAADLAAFNRLCESIDLHMPQVTHYVVIDRADEVLFGRFASPKRRIMIGEALLPGFHPLLLGGRRFWYRRPHRLVRGWIFQQLAKLKATSTLQEDAVVLVDSDVAFFKPLEMSHIFDAGRVKLYHWPGVPSGPPAQSDKWHNAACRALGLERNGYTGADYISTVIAWSPKVVRAMLQRIEAQTGREWSDALLRDFRFSECVLYGVFCELVPGEHVRLVVPTRESICHWCWPYNFAHPAGIDAFINGIRPDKVAALLQSNRGISEEVREYIFEEIRRMHSS